MAESKRGKAILMASCEIVTCFFVTFCVELTPSSRMQTAATCSSGPLSQISVLPAADTTTFLYFQSKVRNMLHK